MKAYKSLMQILELNVQKNETFDNSLLHQMG